MAPRAMDESPTAIKYEQDHAYQQEPEQNLDRTVDECFAGLRYERHDAAGVTA